MWRTLKYFCFYMIQPYFNHEKSKKPQLKLINCGCLLSKLPF